MLLAQARQDIVTFSRKLITDHLTVGTGGNISIYDPEKKMFAISPSGIDYFDMTAEDVQKSSPTARAESFPSYAQRTIPRSSIPTGYICLTGSVRYIISPSEWYTSLTRTPKTHETPLQGASRRETSPADYTTEVSYNETDFQKAGPAGRYPVKGNCGKRRPRPVRLSGRSRNS